MASGQESEGLLAPYRVLDLADEGGVLAGKVLADLGADVVAVEPPDGNPVRRLPPFYQDRPGPERSLVWWAYAAGKRSVILDLEREEGRDLLRRLAASADFLLESFRPGHLGGLGLGYDDLRGVNPRLVMVSMTPFGQDGPYAAYQGPDLVGMALGGLVNLTGDPDRAPVRVSEAQFGRHAGASGAAGAMIAHHHRLLTGEGQHVDVSGQQAVARVLAHAPAFWSLTGVDIRRSGAFRERLGGVHNRITWPCKDGYVNYNLSGGSMGTSTNALMGWMRSEGYGDEALWSTDWTQVDFNTVEQPFLDRAIKLVEPFLQAHTKRELHEGALQRRILLFPVNTPRDLESDPQLAARGFFTPIAQPEDGALVTFPGGFVRSTERAVGPRRRAPRLGEHSAEVYGELGLDDAEVQRLRRAKVI